MRPRLWSCAALVEALVVPGEPEVAGELVIVDGGSSEARPDRLTAACERLAALPCLVVDASGGAPTELVDVVAATSVDLEAIIATFERSPSAATSLALHLRASERRSVADGLVAESALYSALQAGPEHRAWREANPARDRGEAGEPRLRVDRVGDELRITLARPEVRNALDAAMRDQLLDALAIAEADPSLRVVLRGEGRTFCAGGDLDEFGTAPDPATAHVIRLRRSAGGAIARVADRTTVHVHGSCAGSGVELAAFAGHVIAHPDATFVLPELALGLIPGAGGTVSLPARIGRHRTALLALAGRPIDAATAEEWGLIDAIN